MPDRLAYPGVIYPENGNAAGRKETRGDTKEGLGIALGAAPEYPQDRLAGSWRRVGGGQLDEDVFEAGELLVQLADAPFLAQGEIEDGLADVVL